MSGRPHWTRDAVLRSARDWAEIHGQAPRAREWSKAGYGHPSHNLVRLMFGSWNEMVVAAGFRPRPNHNPGNAAWTRETILAAVRLFVERNGRPPRGREWLLPHVDYPHRDVVTNRFGSWNTMLAEAGFEPLGKHPPRAWTRDQVAAAFLDFLVREGRWPTTRDCDRSRDGGLPSKYIIYALFDSLGAAKRFSGWVDPSRRRGSYATCSGCGCSRDNFTIGCRTCGKRRRARAARNAPGRLVETASPPDSRACVGGRARGVDSTERRAA